MSRNSWRLPRRLEALLCIGFVLSALWACEPPPISELSSEEGIGRIRSDHKEERWEKVIQDVNEYRSRYPYAQSALEAELLQADAYFQSERFPEAVAAYEEFVRKNPSHPQAPFAMFRAARSYDKQSPEEIDREQIYALRALERFNQFLEVHGQSPYATEAKERIAVLKRRLAEHSAFVARFYWKKDLYQGALTRYLELLSEYGNYDDLRAEAQERAAVAYEELAKELEKDPKSDKVVYFRGQTPADLRKKAEEVRAGRRKSN